MISPDAISGLHRFFEFVDGATYSELVGLDQAEKLALVQVIALAMHADGVVLGEEVEFLEDVVAQLPGFEGADETELSGFRSQAVISVAAAHDTVGGVDEALADVARTLQSPQLREVTYGMAVAMMWADGVLVGLERDFLTTLATALDIEDQRALELDEAARAWLCD
jgi:hypothetical protein